jgi:hypothetical protein
VQYSRKKNKLIILTCIPIAYVPSQANDGTQQITNEKGKQAFMAGRQLAHINSFTFICVFYQGRLS